jgi:two-component system sensor histidine kinase KdpD
MAARKSDSELLLNHIPREEEDRVGKLKIFFGYAAGVGKTYAMLEAAHKAKELGIDVVAGYIEPHTRPETMKLLDGLEVLPPLKVNYKGVKLREFDLNGALERHPQLILVDELAHTNAEGCRHRKRYQDIEELRRAGIHVYTTVNVQHLESLNDVVSSITGIVVNERVPDSVFDSASQVELVDIEPDDLIMRLEEGKVYQEGKARQALNHFFTRKNLAALREIALRRTADQLNRAAENSGEQGVLSAGEHVMVCLSSSPSNAKVIRTAARMAEAFHSSLTALYVETSDAGEKDRESQRRLRENTKLAEDLGARIATVYGDNASVQIAEYARVSGISKIVIGRSNTVRPLFSSHKNLTDQLTAMAPNTDVYIIPDNQPPYRSRHRNKKGSPAIRFSGFDFMKMMLMLALGSAIGGVFDWVGLGEANIITVYILGVLGTAIWTQERIYSVFASLLSVVVFNFLFTEPRFTLHAYDAGYPITFAIMLAAGLITSSLTRRVKQQAKQAALKAYRTQVLFETSQKLQKADDEGEILQACAEQLKKLLNRPVFLYPVEKDGDLGEPLFSSGCSAGEKQRYTVEDEKAVARWVSRNNKHAGATTGTLPGAECLYMAVRGGQNTVFAVAGIPMEGQAEPDSFEKNLLIALLDESGLVLEKFSLDKARREMEMTARQESLRANLLRTISHDLRTPLTSITGNAGILMENSSVLDEAKKQELYTGIYDDSMWLYNLVENLLSVTRMGEGSVRISLEPELLDDVFREAIRHLDRRASEHTVRIHLEDELLMARMDARLIVQVVINIVNNAIKYTQPGSVIEISAHGGGGVVTVEIADDGPGIAEEDRDRLFDMFYTAGNERGDGRRGLGLGLALCRSIVQAHGGTIGVRKNEPKGCVFYFTLVEAEVTNYE